VWSEHLNRWHSPRDKQIKYSLPVMFLGAVPAPLLLLLLLSTSPDHFTVCVVIVGIESAIGRSRQTVIGCSGDVSKSGLKVGCVGPSVRMGHRTTALNGRSYFCAKSASYPITTTAP
jgi:hypothetical protein